MQEITSKNLTFTTEPMVDGSGYLIRYQGTAVGFTEGDPQEAVAEITNDPVWVWSNALGYAIPQSLLRRLQS